MNRLIVSLCFCLLANVLAAWNNLSLDKLSDEHPRYLTDKSSLKDVQRMIEKEAWASDVFQQLKVRTDQYVDKGTDWCYDSRGECLYSRTCEVFGNLCVGVESTQTHKKFFSILLASYTHY